MSIYARQKSCIKYWVRQGRCLHLKGPCSALTPKSLLTWHSASSREIARSWPKCSRGTNCIAAKSKFHSCAVKFSISRSLLPLMGSSERGASLMVA